MDLMRSRITLRERSLLEVLDLALRFSAAHARAQAALSLAVIVPGFAVSWAAAALAGWWAGWAATLVLGAFATAPFVALASRLVFADTVRTRSALAMAARALPRLLAVRLLELLAFVASAPLLGLPWLYAGAVLLFAVEVVVLEGAGVRASLRRAQRLAGAQLAAVLGAALLLLLAPLASAVVADVAGREVLGHVLELRAPSSMFRAGGSALALAGWWAALPLVATSRFLLYLDVRTRTEGWDIQTRFAALAARDAAADRAAQERAA